jgi:class 3 adenylate cyclase
MTVSLPVIFVAQSALVLCAMTGIIATFVVITNKSIDVAVDDSITNNLEILSTNVRSLIREAEPAAREARKLSIKAWGDDGRLFGTSARPTMESYDRSFSTYATMIEEVDKFAYVYQSYQTASGAWVDLGCGRIGGLDALSCTAGNQIAQSYEFRGLIPLNYSITNVEDLDTTNETYVVEIRSMTASSGYNDTGYWARTSIYSDPYTGQSQALMTMSLPIAFSPTDGHCVAAISIDVSIAEVAEQLRSLAKHDNVLYMIDALSLDLLATSLPETAMPAGHFDEDGQGTMWQLPNTPSGEINKGAAKIIAHGESSGGLEYEDGGHVLEMGDTIVSYVHIRHNSLHWIAVDHTPREYYFGDSRRVRDILIVVASIVIAICLAVSIVVYFAVVRPITKMATAMGRISRLEPAKSGTENSANGPSLSELQPMHDAFVKLDLALQSFTRYVPRGVVKELIESNQLCKLAMIPRNCSILFSDIAGFTSISERVPAVHLSRLIHSYFSRMSRIVMHHGGIIDKFIGDCIMAIWGAPLPQEHHELRATLCAMLLDREARVAPLVNEFDEMGEQLAVRVGVNSGDVLAGNMGSDERMNYTVIGDNVNLASRLESLNKQMGTRVMISEFTAARLQKKVVLRLLCRVSVVGKSQPVEVYEPRGINPLTNDTLENAELTYMDLHPDAHASLRELRGHAGTSASYPPLADDSPHSDSVSEVSISDVNVDKEHRAQTLLRQARAELQCNEPDVSYAEQHTTAVRAYQNGDFSAAIMHLEALEAAYPAKIHDKATDYVRTQAHVCLKSRPHDFDGVYHAAEK